MSQEAVSSDPVVEYSLLGNDINDGIFGWIAFGVDTSNNFTVAAAASLYASSGVENSNFSLGGNFTGSGAVPPFERRLGICEG
jgi:hypothetical protein